jgi:hypothetical protein
MPSRAPKKQVKKSVKKRTSGIRVKKQSWVKEYSFPLGVLIFFVIVGVIVIAYAAWQRYEFMATVKDAVAETGVEYGEGTQFTSGGLGEESTIFGNCSAENILIDFEDETWQNFLTVSKPNQVQYNVVDRNGSKQLAVRIPVKEGGSFVVRFVDTFAVGKYHTSFTLDYDKSKMVSNERYKTVNLLGTEIGESNAKTNSAMLRLELSKLNGQMLNYYYLSYRDFQTLVVDKATPYNMKYEPKYAHLRLTEAPPFNMTVVRYDNPLRNRGSIHKGTNTFFVGRNQTSETGFSRKVQPSILIATQTSSLTTGEYYEFFIDNFRLIGCR